MGKLAVTVLVAFGLLAPAAQAAPPGNDDRGSAQALAVPSTVRGTTVDATTEPNEPFSCGGPPANSVWYSIAPSRGPRPRARARRRRATSTPPSTCSAATARS